MNFSINLSLHYCGVCHTNCHKKNNYDKYLLTAKYKKTLSSMDNLQNLSI